MALNCKVGDLAVIVKSWAGNEGKIVTCLEFVGKIEGRALSDTWRIDCAIKSVGTVTGRRFKDVPLCSDSCLRPLRESEGQDETIAWAGRPKAKDKVA